MLSSLLVPVTVVGEEAEVWTKMESPEGLESVVGYQRGRGWEHTEDDGLRSSRKWTTSPLTS